MTTFMKGLFGKGTATNAADCLLKTTQKPSKDIEKGEVDGANEEQTQKVKCDIRCCDSPWPRKIIKAIWGNCLSITFFTGIAFILIVGLYLYHDGYFDA